MSLKLNKNENQTYWIEVEGGWFEIAPMSLSEESRMRKQFTRMKRGQEEIDTTALMKARFNRVVKNWKDIELNHDTNPECNQENKNYIVEWFTDVATEVLIQANNIRDENEKVEDENLGE
jgi:hypothetical protein